MIEEEKKRREEICKELFLIGKEMANRVHLIALDLRNVFDKEWDHSTSYNINSSSGNLAKIKNILFGIDWINDFDRDEVTTEMLESSLIMVKEELNKL